jgi:hypothetical protein
MNKPDTFTIDFPAPLLLSFVLLTAAIQLKLFNQLIADYDLWWHLFIGKAIIENGAIMHGDLYSFTAFGLPYINHEWASEIIMASAFLKLGDTGLIIWRWSLVILIIVLSYQIIKRQTAFPWTRILIFLCFTVVIAPGISFRVQLFSYAFLLILLRIVYASDQRVTKSSLAYTTLLFVLWANLHGAFVLGLVVWFIYVIEAFICGRFRHRWHLGLLACVLPAAATLLNPYGYGLWGFIYREISNPLSAKFITEWQHFSFAPRELPFFIVMLFAWTVFFFSGKPKGIAESIILLLASLMGMMSVRNTPLFVILTLPGLALHMDGAYLRLAGKSGLGRRHPSRKLIAGCAVLITMTSIPFLIFGFQTGWKVQVGDDPLPVKTVAFLKENRLTGNLWVPLHFGGYAMFHLHPQMKVSIDGRWAMVYPRQVMQDNMAFAYDGTGGKWKRLLEKYRARFALVEPGNPAIYEMNQDPDWMWLIKEPSCGLLIRKDDLVSMTAPLKQPKMHLPAWP